MALGRTPGAEPKGIQVSAFGEWAALILLRTLALLGSASNTQTFVPSLSHDVTMR